jgi:hypothetical protein
MISDHQAILSRLCTSLNLEVPVPFTPCTIADKLRDAGTMDRLNKFLFPWHAWSKFEFETGLFHPIFVFVKICTELDVPSSLIPDPFDVIQGEASESFISAILLVLEHHSIDRTEHLGPRLHGEESECTSCLLCRWKHALSILLPESHHSSSIPMSVRRLVEDGIPTPIREHVWLYLSGGLRLIRSRRPHYISLFPAALSSRHMDLIDLDISRTFVDDEDWRLRGFDRITRRVLAAYSVRNETVGYCQGLSYIVGVLVTVVSEESAFVILCAIIEDGLLPSDYYTNLQGAVVDREVLDRLVLQFIPGLVERLAEETGGFDNVNPTSVLSEYTFMSVPWHMCLFSATLDRMCAVRLWDFLFAFGPCVLFRTSLGILHELFNRMVIKSIPLVEVREVLRKIENSLTLADLTIFACHQFTDCDNVMVEGFRELVRKEPTTRTVVPTNQPLTVRGSSVLISDESYFGEEKIRRPSSTRRERDKSILFTLEDFLGQSHGTGSGRYRSV